MSSIITECLMVKAAKGDKKATALFCEKVKLLQEQGHGQTWPCPHTPRCVATIAGQKRLLRVLTLFLAYPEQPVTKQAKTPRVKKKKKH